MEHYQLLKQLCGIHAPSGEEMAVRDFILSYINENQHTWKVKPQLYYGDGFQDCLVLIFGEPRTAVYAHMDSVGFTARYRNEVVKIGGPRLKTGTVLTGRDAQGAIEARLHVDDEEETLHVDFHRTIATGTSLVFKQHFVENYDTVQSCFLDNRLGIWACLQLCDTLENGAIVFSAWEEHGGGSAEFLARFLYEKYGVRQSLISDITWISDGVIAGEGCAISLRDSGIPRRQYLNRIIELAQKNGIKYQLEVESSGGSDGNAIQKIPYPIDWCFVGAGEANVHSPEECVHKKDIDSMLALYKVLMAGL